MKENNIKKIGAKLFLAPFVFALAGCFGGANYAENADDGYYNIQILIQIYKKTILLILLKTTNPVLAYVHQLVHIPTLKT